MRAQPPGDDFLPKTQGGEIQVAGAAAGQGEIHGFTRIFGNVYRLVAVISTSALGTPAPGIVGMTTAWSPAVGCVGFTGLSLKGKLALRQSDRTESLDLHPRGTIG